MKVLSKYILKELNLFKNQIHETENDLLKGKGEGNSNLLKITADLRPNQKAALCYFLPFKNWIKSDLHLMGQCIGQMIGQQVKCEWNQQQERINSPGIGKWLIGINSKIAGTGTATKPGLKVKVYPASEKEFEDLLTGGKVRAFLEQHIYTHFLPEQVVSETEIVVKSKNNFKCSFEKEARVNFQSIISI